MSYFNRAGPSGPSLLIVCRASLARHGAEHALCLARSQGSSRTCCAGCPATHQGLGSGCGSARGGSSNSAGQGGP